MGCHLSTMQTIGEYVGMIGGMWIILLLCIGMSAGVFYIVRGIVRS